MTDVTDGEVRNEDLSSDKDENSNIKKYLTSQNATQWSCIPGMSPMWVFGQEMLLDPCQPENYWMECQHFYSMLQIDVLKYTNNEIQENILYVSVVKVKNIFIMTPHCLNQKLS